MTSKAAFSMKNLLPLLALSLFVTGCSQSEQPAQPTAPPVDTTSDADTDTIDLIINGDYVVTMDDGGNVVQNGAVAVDAGLILAIGPADEINDQYTAEGNLDGAVGLEQVDGRCRRVAGSEHRVDDDDAALGEVVRDLEVVLHRLQRRFVAVQPDEPDPRVGVDLSAVGETGVDFTTKLFNIYITSMVKTGSLTAYSEVIIGINKKIGKE